MKIQNRKVIWVCCVFIISLLISSCGGKKAAPTEEAVAPGDQAPVESSSGEYQGEQNTSGAEFEEQDLPDDFPEEFPLPEGTKVGSTIPMPGENSFRVFFGIVSYTLEETLIFYNQELGAEGWSVDAEGPEVTGYGMWITHPEYEARLSFIEDEYGVVLDLTLAPLGELEVIPGSGEPFGDNQGLGNSGGDFPADFPVPPRFSAIDLPPKLAQDGYQLAFTFPDLAEIAIIELSNSLRGGNWEIGDAEIDAATMSYRISFTSSDGFQGYALITSKADVAGIDPISGAVIALHAGSVE